MSKSFPSYRPAKHIPWRSQRSALPHYRPSRSSGSALAFCDFAHGFSTSPRRTLRRKVGRVWKWWENPTNNSFDKEYDDKPSIFGVPYSQRNRFIFNQNDRNIGDFQWIYKWILAKFSYIYIWYMINMASSSISTKLTKLRSQKRSVLRWFSTGIMTQWNDPYDPWRIIETAELLLEDCVLCVSLSMEDRWR